MRFFLGLAMGAALSLLIAPELGNETRTRIAAGIDSFVRDTRLQSGGFPGGIAYETLKSSSKG